MTNVSLKKVWFHNGNIGWGIGSQHPYQSRIGIYHTTDGGRLWVEQLKDTADLYDLKFTDAQKGWVIGRGFIWQTTDGGAQWAHQTSVKPTGGDYALSFKDSILGWAGGWSAYAIKTTDGGVTWILDSTLAGYNRFNFVDSTYGWASSTGLSSQRREVARTTDGGVTWAATASSIIGLAFPFTALVTTVFTDDGVYSTTDGGTTWDKVSNRVFRDGWLTADQTLIAYESSGFRFLSSTDRGATWDEGSFDVFGPGNVFLKAIEFVDSLNGWILGRSILPDDYFVARTTDAGMTWQKTGGTLPSEGLDMEISNSNLGWVVGQVGMILRTTNGGISWLSQFSGTTDDLWDIEIVDANVGYVVGGTPGNLSEPSTGIILKTTNSGESWFNVGPPGLKRLNRVSFVDPMIGWAAGSGQWLRTDNGGSDWQVLDNPEIEVSIFEFVSEHRGWASILSHDTNLVVTTTDGGLSWIPQLSLYGIAGGPVLNGKIVFLDSARGWIAGGAGLVFSTTDGGGSWMRMNLATTRQIQDVEVLNGGSLFLAGDYGMILGYRNDEVTGVRGTTRSSVVERNFVLKSVYPNPSNAGVNVVLDITTDQSISVSIHDVLGRRVFETDLGRLQSGSWSIPLNLSEFSSGVFFVHAISSKGSQVVKIVIIK